MAHTNKIPHYSKLKSFGKFFSKALERSRCYRFVINERTREKIRFKEVLTDIKDLKRSLLYSINFPEYIDSFVDISHDCFNDFHSFFVSDSLESQLASSFVLKLDVEYNLLWVSQVMNWPYTISALHDFALVYICHITESRLEFIIFTRVVTLGYHEIKGGMSVTNLFYLTVFFLEYFNCFFAHEKEVYFSNFEYFLE